MWCWRSQSRRARRYHWELLEESRVTSDPSLRAVFVEDAVSVSGDVLALAALALNQITGSSIPQGVAAVLIVLVTIGVSLRLISRSSYAESSRPVREVPGQIGVRLRKKVVHTAASADASAPFP